jgi:Tol biopolymer transport system component
LAALRSRGAGVAAAALGPFWPRPARAHGLPMDVFVVGVDGANLRRLTQLGEDNPAPAWSPDGRQIAILAGGGVYRLNADGGDLTSIDQKGGHGAIDWQPNAG